MVFQIALRGYGDKSLLPLPVGRPEILLGEMGLTGRGIGQRMILAIQRFCDAKNNILLQ